MNSERELLWLRRLRDLTRSLARESERQGLIERVLDAALELTDAERGYLVLVDPQRGLSVRASRGIGKAELARSDHPSRRAVQRALSQGGKGLVTSRQEDADLLGVTSLRLNQVTSVACVCLDRADTKGVLYLETRDPQKAFGEDDLPILATFADQAALALEFVEEVAEPRPIAKRLAGQSLAVVQLRALLERLAGSSETVLITGESGVGKELAARTLHDLSRPNAPFRAEACGALSPTLWESELFGHEKGAFSGADHDRKGVFELAEDGTLLLDEVADLPLPLQAKLLRVLQEREVRPLGGRRTVPVRCRILASTAQDLQSLVSAGSFREDLYYRLDVLRAAVPPLRERPEDIPELIEQIAAAQGRTLKVSSRALQLLQAWHWPGNVRELCNEVERLFVEPTAEVTGPNLSPRIRESRGLSRGTDVAGKTLGEVECALVQQALRDAGGNKARAARLLGIPRTSLYRLLERYSIS